jgi:hypothetical protein
MTYERAYFSIRPTRYLSSHTDQPDKKRAVPIGPPVHLLKHLEVSDLRVS